MKWKGYDQEEQDAKKAEGQADKFLAEKKRFDTAWRKYDASKG